MKKVTYVRNRNVICGYGKVAGLTQNNLRYYQADFISRDPSSRNKRALVAAATDLLCIKENMYQEDKMTCCGKTLRKDYARRFAENGREMMVVYEPAVIKVIGQVELCALPAAILNAYMRVLPRRKEKLTELPEMSETVIGEVATLVEEIPSGWTEGML